MLVRRSSGGDVWSQVLIIYLAVDGRVAMVAGRPMERASAGKAEMERKKMLGGGDVQCKTDTPRMLCWPAALKGCSDGLAEVIITPFTIDLSDHVTSLGLARDGAVRRPNNYVSQYLGGRGGRREKEGREGVVMTTDDDAINRT